MMLLFLMFLYLSASCADLTVATCRLHVFFGCYHNLFRLMAKCGVLENLLLKEHTHTFVNTGVYPVASMLCIGAQFTACGCIRCIVATNIFIGCALCRFVMSCSMGSACICPDPFVNHPVMLLLLPLNLNQVFTRGCCLLLPPNCSHVCLQQCWCTLRW